MKNYFNTSAPNGNADITTLEVVNTTNETVKVWLTLNPGAGYVSEVKPILEASGFKHGPGDSLQQGWFELPSWEINMAVFKYQPPAEQILSGNFAFGGAPACPTPAMPAGTNIFQFTLNAPGKWETINISCQTGLNSLQRVELYEGPEWFAGTPGSGLPVRSFANNKWGGNCNVPGIVPTGMKNPCGNKDMIECPDQSTFVEINREGGGGKVGVVFTGFVAQGWK